MLQMPGDNCDLESVPEEEASPGHGISLLFKRWNWRSWDFSWLPKTSILLSLEIPTNLFHWVRALYSVVLYYLSASLDHALLNLHAVAAFFAGSMWL